MKSARIRLYVGLFVLFLTQTAAADLITIERSFWSGGHPRFLQSWGNNSFSWMFDLRPQGFDPDTQDITSATLILRLSDDGQYGQKEPGHQREYATLDVGGDHFAEWRVSIAVADKRFPLNQAVGYLNDHGVVTITLRATTEGDYAFHWAKLEANVVSQQTEPVPEPGSLGLLLLGLVWGRTRLKGPVARI